jgi:hypothetical protein
MTLLPHSIKMQKTTAQSTAEAEYYSASTAGSEVPSLYLSKLLERMWFAQTSPTPVYEDDTAFIEWGTNCCNICPRRHRNGLM